MAFLRSRKGISVILKYLPGGTQMLVLSKINTGSERSQNQHPLPHGTLALPPPVCIKSGGHPRESEVFEEAGRVDKPIFLNIGYSTWHWHHVMVRESWSHSAAGSPRGTDPPCGLSSFWKIAFSFFRLHVIL